MKIKENQEIEVNIIGVVLLYKFLDIVHKFFPSLLFLSLSLSPLLKEDRLNYGFIISVNLLSTRVLTLEIFAKAKSKETKRLLPI